MANLNGIPEQANGRDLLFCIGTISHSSAVQLSTGMFTVIQGLHCIYYMK